MKKSLKMSNFDKNKTINYQTPSIESNNLKSIEFNDLNMNMNMNRTFNYLQQSNFVDNTAGGYN
jgi:hypothetical protein